jgi:hypothetical protein
VPIYTLKATKRQEQQSSVSFAVIRAVPNTQWDMFASGVLQKSLMSDDRVAVFEEKAYMNDFQ